ncbi:cell cycle protein kinase dbf2-related [Anaeramoeba flamelloides]|uniref:non-specific serine/threonine protein kinase n=1 Tax=Anaeramoeba flamelloides TaxID=1746091 RepID=A0AAV7YGJ4_9EUKA|nr:cell cycle protein kinase dbf2-related [Anaeramoeba flamelloides]KAJ6234235.1 cell cycle protein kinase dbf2-related [Anaeramoeba flamelloides]
MSKTKSKKKSKKEKKKSKKTSWDMYDKTTKMKKKISSRRRRKAALCKKYLERTMLEANYYLYKRKKRIVTAKRQITKNKVENKQAKVILKEVFFNETEFLRNQRSRIIVEDFVNLAKIGEGSFGEVFLVKKNTSRSFKQQTRIKEIEKETEKEQKVQKKKNKNKNKNKEKKKKKSSKSKNKKKSQESQGSEPSDLSETSEQSDQITNTLGEIYALKRVEKKKLKTRKQVQNIWTEREVLAIHNSPWLVKLYESFQDDKYLYFVMDYHSGGDLKCLLNQINSLNEDSTRFYLAEMILTVDDLHKQGFIHRDLKPENFLISSKGHLKLTDFGLSKNIFPDQKNWKATIDRMTKEELNKKKHFTLVGTPNYMSPEILSRKGYDNSVDFWSLGCILYELLAGFPPFSGDEIEETLRNIIFHTKTLTAPTTNDGQNVIGEEAWDLITVLLDVPIKDEESVFIKKLKKHKFFEGIDWVNLRTSTPPFVPELDNEKDISYFDTTYFDDFDGQLKTVITNFGTPKSFSKKDINNKFVGFTFKRYEDK